MVTLTVDDFGLYQEKTVKKFTWRSSESGLAVSVISYGAIVQSIKYPDTKGVTADVVLGFDDLESYVSRNTQHFGGTIGRCANRIAKAAFEIDGVTYNLAKNQGEDHLHGGVIGFDKVLWDTTIDENRVIFSYLSKDGEESYPGDLVVNVTFELLEDDTLHVDFMATTSKKTVVNLTNHSYFNLAGHDTGAETLELHIATINADMITVTDSDSIPTGEFKDVAETTYDFRVPKKLGDLMQDNLFDDNFCISNYRPGELNFISRVVHPTSGRFLQVYSDQPGVQFYTSNSLPLPSEEALVGKNSVGYRRHQAFCLETQKFPDAVNHAHFPSTVLTPGEVYSHRVVYQFGLLKSREPEVISA